MNLAICIKKHDNVAERLKEIINDERKINEVKENILKFAKPDASINICKIIFDNKSS